MKFKSYLLLFLLFLLFLVEVINNNAEISINEIMANPQGSDNGREFIEIIGTNNLSDFTIGDNVQNDTLEILQFSDQCNFSLIVEENFDYSNLNCSIYNVGNSIGNGLSNDFDDVYLYYNFSVVDHVTYTQTIEGYSYSKFNNFWNFSELINGTPCISNLLVEIEDNSSYNNTNMNQSDELNYTTNETINNSDFCNVSINISLDDAQAIYFQGDKIKFKNLLSNNSFDFIIEYWITDYFNQTLKSKINTSNSNQKQWTVNIDSTFSIILVKSKLVYLSCQNIIENAMSELVLIVANSDELSNEENNNTTSSDNEDETFSENSVVTFEKISYDNYKVYTIGNVYKGNTAKRLFKFYIECQNNKNKSTSSEEIKFYLTKYETLDFDETMYITELIEECVTQPILVYEGLELSGSEEINDCNISNDELNSNFIQNNDLSFGLQIQSQLQNIPELIFSYNSNEIVKSDYFTMIQSSESQNKNNLITGNFVKSIFENNNLDNTSLNIEPNSKKIINIVIMSLLILSLILILVKK